MTGSRRPTKNREGLGTFITWVDPRWTLGGGANIQICTHTIWKQVSYRRWWVVLITLTFGVQNCNRALKQIIQCVVWQLDLSPPPLCPPCIHLTSFTWWMLPGLPHSLPAMYYCLCKQGRPGNEARVVQCRLQWRWYCALLPTSNTTSHYQICGM